MEQSVLADGLVYDLHITVNPINLWQSLVVDPWKTLEIKNVQGMPHCIVSRKYIGNDPTYELGFMCGKLSVKYTDVLRKKIELHFRNPSKAVATLAELNGKFRTPMPGIVEIHYKYKQRGIFPVNAERVEELNRKKLALSFNVGSGRLIVSARFENLTGYKKCRASDELPDFLDEEEREVVVFDTNNGLDSFWPMRTAGDPPLNFNDFPVWALQQ